MPWTTPRTWVAKEKITAALLNTHLRDNLDYLYSNAPAIVSSGYATVGNSTTETTVHTQSLAANALGTKGAAVLTGHMQFQTDTANRAMTMRIKLGGTTIFAPSVGLGASGAQHTSLWWSASISNQNSASAQRATLHVHYIATGNIALSQTTFTTANTQVVTGISQNTATVDTTSAQTLAVTVQLSAANASFVAYHHDTIVNTIYVA